MRDPTVPLSGADPAAGSSGDGKSGDAPAEPRTVPLRPQAAARVEPTFATAPVDGGRAEDYDPDHAERLVGRILGGKYEVRRVLGRGGMGIVYDGRHIDVGRPLAIKVLRRDLARSTQAVARFHREARAAASVGSAHIVDVLDFGYSDAGDAYIVMELLEGDDLGQLIRREGPLPEARAVAIARQIARALEAAHSKGIIHRDLKSENVFVVRREDTDFVKLLDFGISKMTEGDEGRGPMTTEGVVMGTPHYMAPEQATSDVEPDHRIDLYALGCIFYEMVTGRVPFTGRNVVEVVFKHVHEPPVPPSRVRPDVRVSPEVEAVILRALAKNRDARFADAGEFLAVLPPSGQSLTGLEAQPAPTPPTPPTSPPPAAAPRLQDRRRALGLGGALLAAVAAATVGVAVFLGVGTDPTARPARGGAPRVDGGGPRTAAIAGAVDAGQGEADAADAAIAAREAPDATAAADTLVQLSVAPAFATIELNGEPAGRGSFRGRFPQGSRLRVVVEAPGYEREEDDLVLEGPVRRRFRLARVRRTAPVAAPAPDAAVVVAAAPDAGSAAPPPDVPRVIVDPGDLLHTDPYGYDSSR